MRTIARRCSSSAACLLSISLLISTPVSSETNKPARLSLGDTSLERFEIDMGTPARQTVLTGFLRESKTADLGIVHLTSERLPTLRLYSLAQGDWKLNQETLLPRDLLMVDIVRIGNQDRILGYRPGELLWFGSDMKQMEGHLTLTSNFTPPRPNEVPHVDMTEDLNGDGRDDLVVPAQDGFWVATQKSDQSFDLPIKIGQNPDLSGIYGADGYRYRPWSESRIYPADFNHDSRVDLVYWTNGHFVVHDQDSKGQFSNKARRYPAPSFIKTNNPYALAQKSMTGRVLLDMTDLNNDGVTDLVIAKQDGRSISKKQSRYNLHYGTRTPDATTQFSETPDITFEQEGKIYINLDLTDLDQDGRAELVLTSIPKEKLTNSLWKRLKGFMGDDVRLTLDFYRSPFSPEQPNHSRTIALDGFPSHREPGYVPLDLLLRGPTHAQRKLETEWPRAFNPTMLIGDVTGDNHSELLISSHPRQLSAHVGTSTGDLFSAERHSIPIDMPDDGEYAWLADLNQDGKMDILLHRTFIERDAHGGRKQPLGSESQKLTLLLTR